MADQDDIRVLGEEWSALADAFLESDKGLRLMAEWSVYERPIAIAVLKAYADLPEKATKEAKKFFSDKRRNLHVAGLTAMEQVYAGLGKDVKAARQRWQWLRAMVADVAISLAAKMDRLPVSRRSEDLITRAIEMLQGQGHAIPPEIFDAENLAADRPTVEAPMGFGGFLMELEDGREEDDKPTCQPESYDPASLFEATSEIRVIEPAQSCHVSRYQASLPPPMEQEDEGRPSYSNFPDRETPIRSLPQSDNPAFSDEEITTQVEEIHVDPSQIREWELLEGKKS